MRIGLFFGRVISCLIFSGASVVSASTATVSVSGVERSADQSGITTGNVRVVVALAVSVSSSSGEFFATAKSSWSWTSASYPTARNSGSKTSTNGGANFSSSVDWTIVVPESEVITVNLREQCYREAGGDTTYSKNTTATYTFTMGDQPQTVTISPASANILSGQYVVFTASGGHNDYQWIVTGGGVTKSGDQFAVRGGAKGSFSLTVWSPAGNGYSRSNDATAVFTVKESFNKQINLPKNEGSRPVQYLVMQGGEVVAEYIQQSGAGARIVSVVVESDASLTVVSRVVGIIQDEHGVWIVDPNNNSPDTISGPIAPDSSEHEPGESVDAPKPNAPNPGLPNNDNAPVWNAPTVNGDPNGQVDLLTNSIFREGIDHLVDQQNEKWDKDREEAQERAEAMAEYIGDADNRVGEKAQAYFDKVKTAVQDEFDSKWGAEVGNVPDIAAVNVTAPGASLSWPHFTLPILGTVELSPYRLPWLITIMHACREIVLWLMVWGFCRFSIEKATDYSIQVSTVPNATTTQDLIADAVPLVAEKVQYVKQGVTALILVVTLIVMFGAVVGLINTGIWSALGSGTIVSAVTGVAGYVSAALSGAASPLWGFIADFFPLGAFITLLIAEILLLAFMAPLFLLASVFVRSLRA